MAGKSVALTAAREKTKEQVAATKTRKDAIKLAADWRRLLREYLDEAERSDLSLSRWIEQVEDFVRCLRAGNAEQSLVRVLDDTPNVPGAHYWPVVQELFSLVRSGKLREAESLVAESLRGRKLDAAEHDALRRGACFAMDAVCRQQEPPAALRREGNAKLSAADAMAPTAWRKCKLLSAADLSKLTRIPQQRIETALSRFANDSPDCRREVDGRATREPQYVYVVAKVKHIIESLDQ